MPKVLPGLALGLFTSFAVAADINELEWMSGCWNSIGHDAGSGEQWTQPAGGTMLGVSRTVVAGETVAFEFIRIVTEDDGNIAYIASPSGQDTARFLLTEISPGNVVFSNPAHDFPQRIIYRLVANGDMLGRIEGTVNGQNRSVDFPLTKSSCDQNGTTDQ